MLAETWLLIALILTGAALVVVHCILIWTALRASDLDWRWRALAFIPVLALPAAWKAGYRVWPIVWGVLLVGYAVLRVVAGG